MRTYYVIAFVDRHLHLRRRRRRRPSHPRRQRRDRPAQTRGLPACSGRRVHRRAWPAPPDHGRRAHRRPIFFTPLPPASRRRGLLALVSIALILRSRSRRLPVHHAVLLDPQLPRRPVVAQTVVAFLSGAWSPWRSCPRTAKQVLAWWLPFVHFTTTPSQIYLGRVDTLGALGLIAAQLAWVRRALVPRALAVEPGGPGRHRPWRLRCAVPRPYTRSLIAAQFRLDHRVPGRFLDDGVGRAHPAGRATRLHRSGLRAGHHPRRVGLSGDAPAHRLHGPDRFGDRGRLGRHVDGRPQDRRRRPRLRGRPPRAW